MLDLRRLRLLHELHARGTIAAVAQADLAAAAGRVAGRGRIASFQSVGVRVAVPAIRSLAREAPDLRCELIESEPEESLPALALGDVDLVLADEWEHQPLARPAGIAREDLHTDPVHLVLPEGHPAARRDPVPVSELAGERWTTGHRGTAWEDITNRTCRRLGGFDPDIRHRTNDSVLSLALVAGGQAVTLLPQLVQPGAHPGVAVRGIAAGTVHRTIFAATRAADAQRPSVQALLAAELLRQRLQEREPGRRSVDHRDRDRPVERDHRISGHPLQQAVEGGDLAPSGVLRPARLVVQRGDLGLQQILA